MSNDIAKADQIAHRVYTKLALLVHNARATTPSSSNKPDKWFNLETPDTDVYKDVLRPYRAVSAGPPPPFALQVLLSVPALNANQVLVYRPDNTSSRIRVEPTPRLILLESWSLHFAPHPPADSGIDLAPSTIYKHGIGLFRSIYTLLHVLPAWKLANRLRRRNGAFTIVIRVARPESEEGLLEFDTPPSPAHAPLQTTSINLPPLPHPHGALALTVKHLLAPQYFALDELESVLSSRLLSLDDDREGEDVPFTPTLVKNQARESLRSATSTSASPRQDPSSALAAARTRTYSTQTSTSPHLTASNRSPSARAVPLPTTMTNRQTSEASGISAASSHSHTRSREEGAGIGIGAGFTARARKESSTSLRGADLPSSPVPLPSSSPTAGAGPLPIRRPALALNPFKSSTLSTSSSPSPSLQSPSLSLRQTSPLALAGRQIPVPVPTPSRVPPSPIGGGMTLGSVGSRTSSSPAAGAGGASLSSADGTGGVPISTGAGRGMKRYSSSFGHRYKDSGGGSDASASASGSAVGVSGSGERERKEGGASLSPFRPPLPLTGTSQGSQGTSFPSLVTRPTADEEDLSAFMQDINQRKPLGRHLRTQSESASPGGQPYDREMPTSSSSSSRGSMPFGHPRSGTTSEYPPATDRERPGGDLPGRSGQVLTTQDAIGEELQRMNAEFAATLDMLGRRRERTSSSPSPSPSSGSASGVRARPYRDSSLSRGMREFESPRRRAQRISEVTEASTESGGGSPTVEREGGEALGLGLVLGPRPGSRADSVASDQVIGRLELDDDRRRSMGR